MKTYRRKRVSRKVMLRIKYNKDTLTTHQSEKCPPWSADKISLDGVYTEYQMRATSRGSEVSHPL